MSPSLHFDRLIACLLAALLVTAAIPATVVAASDAGASDSASDPEVRFTEKIYHEQRGDVFEIGVSLSGTDAATVRIGPDANDSATVVVRDEDGDGRATVLLNTYDWTFRASDGDTLTVREPASDALVADDDHSDVVVHPERGTDRDPTDVATLVVSERSTGDLRTWVAPRSADLSNLSAVNAAKASENLTRIEAVTRNDTLVLELRALGLEGALAVRNGSNVTGKFFDLLKEQTVNLTVVQTNPGPSVRPAEIQLSEGSTHVVADPVNDRYYVVTDLGGANAVRGARDVKIRSYHEYEANFSLAAASPLAMNETESAATTFAVVDPTAELSTTEPGREFVVPGSNRTVRGTTSLPPGSAITVDLRSTDGERRLSETVRVRNGSGDVDRFEATFDLGDATNRTNFTADVRAADYPTLAFDTAHVIVLEPTASTEISTVGVGGLSTRTRVSHGGFVVVRKGSVDGERLGASRYLEPGVHDVAHAGFDHDLDANETVVAVAYRDADGDGEFDPGTDSPYEDEGTVVADAAEFTVEPTTRTATTADPATSTAIDAPVRDETTDAPGTVTPENEGGIPGFGVGEALIALLAVAVLARRR